MHDDSSAVHDSVCRNCEAPLAGPYCAHCGQHAHDSARSLHVLFHEAWHLLTHLDGRLWITLKRLLFAPGRLTLEYFEDRRARYVPPFQLYFVISVAFFAIAALTDSFSMDPSRNSTELSAADRAELHGPETPAIVGDAVDAATAGRPMTTQEAATLCGHLSLGSAWLDLRLRAVCMRHLADEGRSMLHEFGALVPKMMFVFLPLMAFVMLALYRSPARFYVEHLVFFLHLQSDLFLLMILRMLLHRLANALPALDLVSTLSSWVFFGYAVWYGYAALRRFYGQDRGRTLMKYAAVMLSYLVCFSLSLAGTLIISALVT